MSKRYSPTESRLKVNSGDGKAKIQRRFKGLGKAFNADARGTGLESNGFSLLGKGQ